MVHNPYRFVFYYFLIPLTLFSFLYTQCKCIHITTFVSIVKISSAIWISNVIGSQNIIFNGLRQYSLNTKKRSYEMHIHNHQNDKDVKNTPILHVFLPLRAISTYTIVYYCSFFFLLKYIVVILWGVFQKSF